MRRLRRFGMILVSISIMVTALPTPAHSIRLDKLGEWSSFSGFSISDDFASGCTRDLAGNTVMKIAVGALRKSGMDKPGADCSIYKGDFLVDDDDVLIATAEIKISLVKNDVLVRRPGDTVDRSGDPFSPYEGAFRGRLKIAQWQDDNSDEGNRPQALRECNTDILEATATFVTIETEPCEMVGKADFVRIAWRGRQQDVRDRQALEGTYPPNGTTVYSIASGYAHIRYLKLERVSGT